MTTPNLESSQSLADPLEPEESAVALRAWHLSFLPNAGSDIENWERARLELREERQLIAERAAELALSDAAGGDVDNWLLAERQLDLPLRMRRVYRTKVAYWEGSSRAQTQIRERIARRAEDVAASSATGTDIDNWLCAECQVLAEVDLVSRRAGNRWVGAPAWLLAEHELIAEGILPTQYTE